MRDALADVARRTWQKGAAAMLGEPAWRREGAEPDYRFTLANERTFLAWIRTALALLAAGVLLDQFAAKLQPRAAMLAMAIALCAVSALVGALAYQRWRANELAMRHGRRLPHARALLITALAVTIVASGIGVLIART